MDSTTMANAVRGALLAAPATPRDDTGRIVQQDLENYATAIAGGVDGICVWAHTARGLLLSDAERKAVLAAFRTVTTGPVVAAVGPRPDAVGDFAAELVSTQRVAEEAAAGGADALMVFPAPSLEPVPTRAERTIRLHTEVSAAAGLPVIGFLLYPEAGGVAYGPELLAELCARPEVLGVKLATLYDAMACQDAIAAIHSSGALAITGEDRMFGPSLMWGADAALVGIAAAGTAVSRALMRTWFAQDAKGFLVASDRLDRLAVATFRAPMDGYVQRMLWVAEREGILPARSAYDPHGVRLPASERAEIHAAYDALTAS
ncbi:dihydrodipicolinate synthase family protein [Fodinicola acaciae]|uniref:dihydrodipicolinate synthase family protein n=1 Tax=Fodinicola acaciae TaxID=2681555 RepID=UPI001C9E3C30|nr:dihydrodipicolinate synthase family protein [Fodinicola acaciae]